jgi:hypothetical protein
MPNKKFHFKASGQTLNEAFMIFDVVLIAQQRSANTVVEHGIEIFLIPI